MKIRLITLILCLSFCFNPIFAGDINNEHDGNGESTGRGSGNIPVPADPNNEHGMINKGKNYNDGVTAQVPFDGGWIILVIGALGIGILRAYNKRKNNLV